MEHMGDRIKKLRQEHNLSQAQLGASIETSNGHISNVERGASVLSDRAIHLLCLVYGIDEEWLRTGEGRMENKAEVIYKKLSSTPEENNSDLRASVRQKAIKAEQADKLEELFLPGFTSIHHVILPLMQPEAESFRYLLNAIVAEWIERDERERIRFELRLEDCIPNYDTRLKKMKEHYRENIGRVQQHIKESERLTRIGEPGRVIVPILGRAAAGYPMEMIVTHDSLDADDSVAIQPGDFGVKAVGDSMIDAGINDGDYVLIRPQPVAEQGEIALVAIGDGSTIKRFFQSDSHIQLESANTAYEPQTYTAEDDVRVLGKFVRVLHGTLK
jgi:SOS-response transcriptional repressor LexA